jgi:hypothetical protein
MLREVGIIFAALGCVFLWVPLCLLFPYNIGVISLLTTLLLTVVLAYAAYDVKRLEGNNQRRKAGAFIVILMIMLIVALVSASLIFSYTISRLSPFRVDF